MQLDTETAASILKSSAQCNAVAEEALQRIVDLMREAREQAERIVELEFAVKVALNMVDGNGVPPNWDWMRAVLAGKSAEYYLQNTNQE